jgi:hypothetical protein
MVAGFARPLTMSKVGYMSGELLLSYKSQSTTVPWAYILQVNKAAEINKGSTFDLNQL